MEIHKLPGRFGAANGLRAFSTTASTRSQDGSKDDAASRAIADGFKSLNKIPPSSLQSGKKASDHHAKGTVKHNSASPAADHDGKPQPSKSRKTSPKSRQVAVKRMRRTLAQDQKKKTSPRRKQEKDESQDATSRIQSSLQSIVTGLKAPVTERVTTKADRESPRKMSRVQSSIGARESGGMTSRNLKIKPLDVETATVPQLSFGLERVLFNPGVYHLRDPRSRVFNFDPYLGSIMPVTEFDFDALKEYITSSKDDTLRNIARKENKKYIGSSSSMTSALSHFHYLLSSWRGIDTSTVSQGFPDKMRTFTRLLRSPAAMFLRYQDGVYAIDADKEFDSANVLMNLGKSMEKLLTLPKEDFERYRRSSSNKISAEEEQAIPEAYHYSTMGDFLMRSQLDAYDPRLPGTGMFDLKTRAVVSIRMDARNFEGGLGYEIKGRFGAFESYEREFYDMIRAAFLKYSLQVRVGRMDGIFVAFHNIERIFGFQYVSLPEMDLALHGQSDTALGDAEFRLSLGLWNKILDKVTEKFPQRSVRLHFETRDADTPFMYIFAEPVTEDEIHAIQTKNKAEIDAYQRRILNLSHEDEEHSPSFDTDNLAVSAEPDSQDDMGRSELPDKDASPKASEESAAEEDSSSPAPNQPAPTDLESSDKQEPPPENRELLTMTLVVKNMVNGSYVDRPQNFKASDNWKVEYEISEVEGDQAHSLYASCQKRREKALAGRGEDETEVANNVYLRRLRDIARHGRSFRKQEAKLDKEKGIVVLDGTV
ncbi:hypothetical protein FE257_001842 [Aspergillus nanangensis]|uniref:Uncharacterized protein n=1 Tax=Aspergillus nanangensis TaxID=2582783 RepID=A0AAD4CD84_ASPNN|nr:hypothetical protein FE257_001842 [Aspergillus nanangensis]